MITDYLTDTATLKSSYAVAADGSRSFNESTIICRFQPRMANFTTSTGEVVSSEAQVFTTTEVKVGDAIEYGGRSYPVQRVYTRRDLNGISHYEVWL